MERIVLVRQGAVFPTRYVELLTEQCPVPPVTLTDMPDTPGKTRPLKTNLRGWWSKLELFAPWNEDLRPCVFFDLDTYILGDISDIMNNPGEEMFMLRDFNSNVGASGMMIIPKKTPVFRSEGLDLTCPHGDGGYIRKFPHRYLQDEYDGIVSYKKHARNEPVGRIVCFHGKPKPHQSIGWARDVWDNAV